MKFFQKTGVAVTITVLAVVAALVIGFGPSLTGQTTEQTVSQEIPARETTATETPAAEVSGTAGDETISNKYIRDDAGLFTRSGRRRSRTTTARSIRRLAPTSPSLRLLTRRGCRWRATRTTPLIPWA